MKFVKMTTNVNGADIDFKGRAKPTKLYVKGTTYELGDKLAGIFVDIGAGQVVDEKGDIKLDEKQSDNVPENKMNTDESENK